MKKKLSLFAIFLAIVALHQQVLLGSEPHPVVKAVVDTKKDIRDASGQKRAITYAKPQGLLVGGADSSTVTVNATAAGQTPTTLNAQPNFLVRTGRSIGSFFSHLFGGGHARYTTPLSQRHRYQTTAESVTSPATINALRRGDLVQIKSQAVSKKGTPYTTDACIVMVPGKGEELHCIFRAAVAIGMKIKTETPVSRVQDRLMASPNVQQHVQQGAQEKIEMTKSQMAQEQKSMMQLTVNQLNNMKDSQQIGHWNVYIVEENQEEGSLSGAACFNPKSRVLSNTVLQIELANVVKVTPCI